MFWREAHFCIYQQIAREEKRHLLASLSISSNVTFHSVRMVYLRQTLYFISEEPFELTNCKNQPKYLTNHFIIFDCIKEISISEHFFVFTYRFSIALSGHTFKDWQTKCQHVIVCEPKQLGSYCYLSEALFRLYVLVCVCS